MTTSESPIERLYRVLTTEEEVSIVQAASELDAFLAGEEGRQALALLAEKRRHFIFGVDGPDSGMSIVYFIDAAGIQTSVEATGMWIMYASKSSVPTPVIRPTSSRKAVEMFFRRQNREPGEVLTWLREKIELLRQPKKSRRRGVRNR
ncbi:hypothetical protein KKF05_05270 [Patescibacteria group bacterium]|nr:hypothetical protein [Patescibacteria group bacterium]